MYTYYFKDNEMLADSFGFAAWKTRINVSLDEYDVLKYVEGKISPPPEDTPKATKSKYKKDEIKAKKIIIDSLRDLLVYISSLKTSKEMYNKIVLMYKVNNLSHIMELKINSRSLSCIREKLYNHSP